MKQHNFFTLVEILSVIAIIGVVSAIGFGTYSFAMNKAKESATKSLIKRIEAALESCKAEYGYYPASAKQKIETTVSVSGDEVTDIKFGGVSLPDDYRKHFLKIVDQQSFLKAAKHGTVADGWGNDILYQYPGSINTTGFDLISCGEDGNESATKTRTGYAESDDLTNF